MGKIQPTDRIRPTKGFCLAHGKSLGPTQSKHRRQFGLWHVWLVPLPPGTVGLGCTAAGLTSQQLLKAVAPSGCHYHQTCPHCPATLARTHQQEQIPHGQGSWLGRWDGAVGSSGWKQEEQAKPGSWSSDSVGLGPCNPSPGPACSPTHPTSSSCFLLPHSPGKKYAYLLNQCLCSASGLSRTGKVISVLSLD